eukprot:TRINITY_DN5824_c0_g1_i18.p1 TRINITY_DN5824_c0_g1~~TRINITY_DN5824_c0_g1_i18.p1  ORF type:complete len:511 (+),score=95.20 TRINITY_DN5824_c0_g1_i18:178-1533(+)
MTEKTFRIAGAEELYVGTQTASSSVQMSKWIPYTPKDPASRSRATFHVMVDPRFQTDADRIAVHGSFDQLGGFQKRGVPLEIDPTDNTIWHGPVELPLADGEFCRTGVFEWRFALERDDEANLEGWTQHRREKSMRPHYYGCFRPNPTNPRFKNYKKVSNKLAVVLFAVKEFQNYLDGAIDALEFLTRFDCLVESFESARRHHAEVIVGRMLKRIEKNTQHSGNTITLLLLAAVAGAFGLSSEDKPPPQQQQNTWSYGAEKEVPKKKQWGPKAWCYYLLEHISAEASCAVDLQLALGRRHGWAVRGIREAAERVGGESTFEWLRVIPFLEKHRSLPNIDTTTPNKAIAKRRAEAFHALGAEIQTLADSMLVTAAEVKDQKEFKEMGDEEKAAKEIKDRENFLYGIGNEWLRSLVRYCPSMASMGKLFQTNFRKHGELAMVELSQWVRRYRW